MAREFSHELADVLVEAFNPDLRLAFFTHTAGGAVSRVDELATAYPHRRAETTLGFLGGWADPADDESAIAAVREWYSAVEPFVGGYYDNIDFDGSTSAGNYGPAFARLQAIKSDYDPGSLFRLNSNIEPRV